MIRVDNTGLYVKPAKKTALIRLVLWSVWLSSGLIVLILLASIAATLFEKPPDSTPELAQRGVSFNENPLIIISMSAEQENKPDEGVQDIITQIQSRKGYSNPTRSAEDYEDESEVTTRRPRRRPVKPIAANFNPNQSFVIRYPNGSLGYVFPSDYTTSRPPRRTAPTVIPESSTQSGAVYPHDLINKIMATNRANFEGAFGEDVVVPDGDALNSRSETPDEPFLCESRAQLIHPQEGLTRNNSKVWIVNTSNFTQGVRVDNCLDAGQSCRYCTFPTVCKQVYHYRTLVAVDKVTNQPYKEQILLPSSCRCARILS